MKGIQVGSNEGLCPFPKGDNYKIAKLHLQILKCSSSEPLGQFQPNLAKSIFGLSGFEFVQMERPHLFKLGNKNKIAKVFS